MTTGNTYNRKEKLKKKKDIDLLFEKGKWRSKGEIRLIFRKTSGANTTQVGVSVSKKNFRRAVDRNRIKRLLRESYRYHKVEFSEAFGKETHAMIFWSSRRKPKGFREVEAQFIQLLEGQST